MEENNKRKLVVVFADNRTDKSVLELLNKMYDVSVTEDYTVGDKKNKKIPDLIIFTGGEDVNPEFYGDKKGSFTKCNVERDLKEKLSFGFHRNITSKIPKLGICRGAQFLTVMNNGKLIQHVEGHQNVTHTIQLVAGGCLDIISDHHQMMYPFNLNKNNYELVGYSKKHLSSVYLDGNDKNMDLVFPFFEPEIVYYPNTNSFCIQAHPEWQIESKDSDSVLRMMNKYLFNTNKETKEEKFNFDDEFDEENVQDWNDENIIDPLEFSYKNNLDSGIPNLKSNKLNPHELVQLKTQFQEAINNDSYGSMPTFESIDIGRKDQMSYGVYQAFSDAIKKEASELISKENENEQ